MYNILTACQFQFWQITLREAMYINNVSIQNIVSQTREHQYFQPPDGRNEAAEL